MLGGAASAVKPRAPGKPLCLREFAATGRPRQTAASPARSRLVIKLLSVLLAAAVVFACTAVVSRRRAASLRHQAVTGVLDAADALEDRLRTARAEIEAVAGDGRNPVRDAMQEMLRQRLWLQQHGAQASLQELDSVRDSIEQASRRIDHQLVQVERARAPLH